MTRRYLQPIQAHVARGRLQSFDWRGTRYRVKRILATWHLQDRWWVAAGKEAGRSSNRTYYRLDCSGNLQCDVYFDVSTSVWILDCIYD